MLDIRSDGFSKFRCAIKFYGQVKVVDLIGDTNCWIVSNRDAVELFRQRQKALEEKENRRRDIRHNLMTQVEEIESELGRALEERKELMSYIM